MQGKKDIRKRKAFSKGQRQVPFYEKKSSKPQAKPFVLADWRAGVATDGIGKKKNKVRKGTHLPTRGTALYGEGPGGETQRPS